MLMVTVMEMLVVLMTKAMMKMIVQLVAITAPIMWTAIMTMLMMMLSDDHGGGVDHDDVAGDDNDDDGGNKGTDTMDDDKDADADAE